MLLVTDTVRGFGGPTSEIDFMREGDLANICMVQNQSQALAPVDTVPILDRLNDSIANGVEWLLGRQHEEGFWVGMLESNSCMEAQWILAMHFLGIEDEKKLAGMVASILNEQRADGSWEGYHNAPGGDINTTVECYAALRCA